MTNREWLESLSDEEFASEISPRCGLCAKQDAVDCGDCVSNITTWLAQEYEPPKKEFTQAQLCEAFELKFGKRRAISLDEIREVAKEIFK